VRVYVGWDQRDAQALKVCCQSLMDHASVPVDIIPLTDFDLRKRGLFTRTYHTRHDPVTNTLQKIDDGDGKPFSTDFSFTRFAVPELENFGSDWVLFCDPDILWRADIAELWEQIERDKSLCCVKHDFTPENMYKMDGVRQTRYFRKAWSSLMAIRPDRCRMMNRRALNTSRGAWLHSLAWAGSDEEIGGLNEEWNWLAGHSSPAIDPSVVHFTSGTPDMEGHDDEPYADEWRAVLNGHAAVNVA